MRTFLALLVGLSVTAFASQALAQDSPQRDAAIGKCVAEAHKQFPGDSMSTQSDRIAAYKACMTGEGQRPVSTINNDIDRRNRLAGHCVEHAAPGEPPLG